MADKPLDAIKVYDISGPEALPGHIPADQVQEAVLSGKYTLPKGLPVPVVSPDGEVGHIPAEQAATAFQQGYKYGTKALTEEATYGTPGQQALAGLEGAAEAVTGGASGAVQQAFGFGDAAAKRSRINPMTHAAGEIAGIVGGMALTKKAGIPTVPGLLGDLGEAASIGAGGKALGMAAQGAVEGAGMAATHAVNEHMLGDPDMTAEAILGHVGLGAALGGGLGLALAPIVSKVGSLLGSLKAPTAESGLAEKVAGTELASKPLADIAMKKTAGEIEAAAADIGAPVLEMQVTDNRAIHHAQQALAKSPSPLGIAEDQKINAGWRAASDAVRGTLEDGAQPMTKVQTGEAIRDALAQKIQQEREPVEALYSELKSKFQDVPLPQAASQEASAAIGKIEGVNLNGRFPEDQLARQVSEELPQLTTLEDLRAYKAKLSRATKADPSLRHVAGATNEILNDLEERVITQFATDAGYDATETIAQRAAAKESYKALAGKLEELGGKLGKRKIYGPQDFLNHLEDMGGEGLVDRLFSKKDPRFLEWFKAQFPEQAQQLATFHKADIAVRATEGEFLSPKAALKQVNQLSPEVRSFLFTPEQLKKLESAHTYISAFPKEMNPSGTAKTMAWIDYLSSPKQLVGQTAADVLAKARISLSGEQYQRFAALVKLKELSLKTLDAIDKSAATILEQGSASALPAPARPHRLIPQNPQLSFDTGRDEYSHNVLKHSDNPDMLAERLAHATQEVAPHAPGTATSLAAVASRATQFLQSKAPPHTKPGPFQPVLPTSNAQMSKYMRYVETVERPVSALARVKDHTLLPQDVEALLGRTPQALRAHARDLDG
jgi:hypothetical protein